MQINWQGLVLLWLAIFRKFHANVRLDPYAYQDVMEERQLLVADSTLAGVDGGVHFLQSYDFIQLSSSFQSFPLQAQNDSGHDLTPFLGGSYQFQTNFFFFF